MKCDCGKWARIKFQGCWKCWDCYGYILQKTDKEDWRDIMNWEKQIELGIQPQDNEPTWATAERAKKKLREMGGIPKKSTA